MRILRVALGTGALCVVSVLASAQPPISTVIGSGDRNGPSYPPQPYPACYWADGIQAKAACVAFPRAVVVGADGAIYYSEYGRVRKVETTGVVTTVAGDRNALPCLGACFDNISALALDSAGNLFIAGYWDAKVTRLAPGGGVTVVAGSGVRGYCGDGGPAIEACLHGPSGLAVDGSGNLYISDNQNSRVRRVDASGTITTVAGNGVLAVCGDGGPATDACIRFPAGIAVNTSGEIFIAEVNQVRKVDAAGIITTVAGGGSGFCGDGLPALGACFSVITGIALDASGNLLIGDARNNRIRQLDTDGMMSTVIGDGRPAFCGDGGPATAACLRGTDHQRNATYALTPAVAPDGSVVVIDTGNSRIRKVDPIAVLTTREFADCRDGTARLTLAAPAPAGGLTAALHSEGPVTVPASITIKAGRTSTAFTIVTEPVAASEVALVSATFAGTTRQDALVLSPIPAHDVVLIPGTAHGGQTVAGTVTLACAAAPGDVTVTLASAKPTLAQPDVLTVTVPQGATTAPFTVNVGNVLKAARVTIYATAGGVTRTATLNVAP